MPHKKFFLWRKNNIIQKKMFQNEFNYYVHVFVSRYMERDDLMKFIKKNFSISFLKNLFSRYTNTNASRTHISTDICMCFYASQW